MPGPEEKRAVPGSGGGKAGGEPPDHLTPSLDQLIDFDLDVQEVQEAIERTSDKVTDKIDWTKAWGKKYPVLVTYQETVDPAPYAQELARLLDRLKMEYGYSELDAMLVLKDILAKVWQARKKNA